MYRNHISNIKKSICFAGSSYILPSISNTTLHFKLIEYICNIYCMWQMVMVKWVESLDQQVPFLASIVFQYNLLSCVLLTY